MARRDGSFRLSKTAKRMTMGLPGWRKALIDAELSAQGLDRMTMNYDVSPDGKVPRKARKEADNG